jgi:5'-nucleotidase
MAETSQNKPIILFTNDDGIQSPGLWEVVKAFEGLGELLIVAPREQQSGMGRSLPVFSEGRIYPAEEVMDIPVADCTAYAVDGTPAQAVQHGVLELSRELPSLVVSGINYGDNTGNGVTISGTVGAAIEAASLGIKAIAVSQQTPHDLHLTYSPEVDFGTAAHFSRMFGQWLVDSDGIPDDIDLLKIDIPLGATIETPWVVTRLSRRRVYWPTRPERASKADIGRLGYKYDTDPSKAEPDSDVHVLLHQKKVSVTPMSLDMTSRTDLFRLNQLFKGERKYGKQG